MKNTKTNVGSFATAKLQAKRLCLLAIIAMVVVIGFSFTACGGGDDDNGGGGGDDLSTWTAVADSTFGTSIGTSNINAIAYGNNRFVAVGENGDMTLLGVRTIEGFKVMVDNIGHRFVAFTAVSCPAHTAVSAMNG